VIDTAVNPYAVSTVVKVGLTPLGMDVDAAGSTVYVVNNGDRTVSSINVAKRTVTATIAVGELPAYVTFNPTGTLAYVTNGDNTVSVIDVAANVAIPSASIPVSSGGLYAFGKFIATGSAINQGLWWNPNESGWGLSLIQHGRMIFNAFFTYDNNNKPTWYVMSSCPLTGTSCTGDIYRVPGGTPPTKPWNNADSVAPAAIGSGTLTFADADHGTFKFTINGVGTGAKTITRQMFATGSAPPIVDYTDLWSNPKEPGWGVALTQQYDKIFVAWFSYDPNGNAIWYVASSCPIVGSGCTGDLYQVTGGSALTSDWNGATKLTAVGTITLTFPDSNHGTMSYFINNVSGSREISLQKF